MSARASDRGTALVTGASRGIGYELAKRFAADGFDAVLVARSEDRLHEVGAELEAGYGVESTVVAADLADPEGARSVYEAVSGDRTSSRHCSTTPTSACTASSSRPTSSRSSTSSTSRGGHDRAHETVRQGDGRSGPRLRAQQRLDGGLRAPADEHRLHGGEALRAVVLRGARGELADAGVTVTALCPGETDTEFTEWGNYEEAAYEPGDLMDPATVAEAGYRGLMNGERVVVPGWKNKLRIFLRRLLPRRAYVRAAERAQNE